MATCCLCKRDLSSGQAKKRRKRLHGPSCGESRRMLNAQVEKRFALGLDEIKEASGDSYLCRECDSKLHRMAELEQQLKQLELELQPYLDLLHPKPSSIAGGSVAGISSGLSGVKRASSVSDGSPSKRPCVRLPSATTSIPVASVSSQPESLPIAVAEQSPGVSVSIGILGSIISIASSWVLLPSPYIQPCMQTYSFALWCRGSYN